MTHYSTITIQWTVRGCVTRDQRIPYSWPTDHGMLGVQTVDTSIVMATRLRRRILSADQFRTRQWPELVVTEECLVIILTLFQGWVHLLSTIRLSGGTW